MFDIPQARALLLRTRPTPNRAGSPASARNAIVALTQRLVAEGRTINSVARELGLHGSTVRSWLQSAAVAGPAFVPVVVAESEPAVEPKPETRAAPSPRPAPPPPPPPPASLTLISPHGFRLEGLDLDSAIAALLRLS